MSKKTLTKEQIEILKKNNYIKSCSSKSITYTPEFKLRAVNMYLSEGLTHREIFKESGFDLDLLDKAHTKDRLRKWISTYNSYGENGLMKDKRGCTGRPRTKYKDDQDKIRTLELQIKYLKAENDFLAKLRAKRAE